MSSTYTNVAYIKVAPGIGMGRVGNSTEYFLGPEVPGEIPSPNNQNGTPSPVGDTSPEAYKDASGAIKPQAQRFKVFAYDSNDNFMGEITNGDSVNGTLVNIEWDVHVTNMKSANYCFQGKYAFDPQYLRNSTIQPDLPPAQRDKLIIDPGVKTISGNSATPIELVDPVGSKIFDISDDEATTLDSKLRFDPPQGSPSSGTVEVSYQSATVSLGNIRTDAEGRLIFVGGQGISESCTTPKVVISKLSLPSGINADNQELNPEYNLNSYFNNPGWYDDTCGGSINATLKSTTTNGTLLSTVGSPKLRGWVAVAPPHYAPATYNVVSLLDLQLDIFPESDPNTGAGPFYVAQTGSDGSIQIAQTSSVLDKGRQVSLTFNKISNTTNTPFQTNFQPAITSYQDQNHIAAVDTLGNLHIGIESEETTYVFRQVSLGDGITATSAPTLAVVDNILFVAVNASGTIYLGAESAGVFTFSAVDIDTTGISIGVQETPALAAFNSNLYLSVVSADNQLLAGNSGQKADTPITLSVATVTNSDTSSSVALRSQSPISMIFHASKLQLGFVSTNNIPYIVSTEDGTNYQGSSVPLLNGTGPQSVPDGAGVSLSSFNGVLYYGSLNSASDAILGQFGEDTLPRIIHSRVYSIESSEQAMPVISTRIFVNFYRDIFPTLKTVTDYAWTNERAFHGHRPGTFGDFLHADYLQALANPDQFIPTTQNANITRSFVFNFIRPPSQTVYLSTSPSEPYRVPPPPNAAIPAQAPADTQIASAADAVQRSDLMPRLFGNGGSPLENSINETIFPNQWLPLTRHQLEKFQQWVNGNFESGVRDQAQYPSLDEAEQLSFAALQPTVGGGFHPGIELTYLMHEATFFEGAFRFSEATIPGEIAAYMSVPWQGDFWSCNVSWWPSLRPDIVVERSDDPTPVLTHKQWFRGSTIPPDSNNIPDYEGGYAIMVDGWKDLGFVTPEKGIFDRGQQVYRETERNVVLDLPSLLTSINYSDISTGQSISDSDTAITAQPTKPSENSQHWRLVPSSAQAGYFSIQKSVSPESLCSSNTPNTLTADFSTNAVTAQPLSPYSEASQLWSYVATEVQPKPGTPITGYPGHFMLKNQSTLKVLTVNSDGTISTTDAVTAPTEDSSPQLWRLDSASS